MVGQCSQSYQSEFDQTVGGSGRQDCLASSGPWGHKELDTTKRLNNNNTNKIKETTQLSTGNYLFGGGSDSTRDKNNYSMLMFYTLCTFQILAHNY